MFPSVVVPSRRLFVARDCPYQTTARVTECATNSVDQSTGLRCSVQYGTHSYQLTTVGLLLVAQCSRQQPHDPILRGNLYTFHVEKCILSDMTAVYTALVGNSPSLYCFLFFFKFFWSGSHSVLYIYTHTYYIYRDIYIYIYTCVYTHTHIDTHTYTYTHIYREI